MCLNFTFYVQLMTHIVNFFLFFFVPILRYNRLQVYKRFILLFLLIHSDKRQDSEIMQHYGFYRVFISILVSIIILDLIKIKYFQGLKIKMIQNPLTTLFFANIQYFIFVQAPVESKKDSTQYKANQVFNSPDFSLKFETA